MSQEIASVKRTFIDGPYGQLHLRYTANAQATTSEKPALYCLHMSPKSSRSYATLMKHMGRHRMCIAADYPGYGESDHPPSEPKITINDYAKNIWCVADAMGHSTQAIDLIGYHTGSFVAVEMAAIKAAHVRKIILISAPIFTDTELAGLNLEYAPIPLDKAGTRYTTLWRRINQHRGPGMTWEMMARSMAENLRGGEHYEWGHRAAFNYAHKFSKTLQGLSQRVTILNPADDCYAATKRSEQFIGSGELIDCPQWGHGFLEAYPDEVTRLINQQLDQP